MDQSMAIKQAFQIKKKDDWSFNCFKQLTVFWIVYIFGCKVSYQGTWTGSPTPHIYANTLLSVWTMFRVI